MEAQNFTLFHRLGNFQFALYENETWCQNLSKWDSFSEKDLIGTQTKCLFIRASSESLFQTSEENNLQSSRLDIKIRKLLSLHPETTDLLHAAYSMFDVTKSPLLYLESMYHTIEEKVLLDTLAQCNKTAVVLPQFEVPRYKKVLAREPYIVSVDVGIEEYFIPSLMVNFHGFPTFPVFKRIQAIHQSGILKWFRSKSPLRDQQSSDNRQLVRPAKVNGNVFVVFVCLFVGQVLSFITVIFEILRY